MISAHAQMRRRATSSHAHFRGHELSLYLTIFICILNISSVLGFLMFVVYETHARIHRLLINEVSDFPFHLFQLFALQELMQA